MAILRDSAFPSSHETRRGKILRARKLIEGGEISDLSRSTWVEAVDTMLERAMPSERQSVEWGERALKGPLARLKAPLPLDERARLRIIACCAH